MDKLDLQCLLYLKHNGLENLLEFGNLVKFEKNMIYNEKINNVYYQKYIKEWKHSSVKPGIAVLSIYTDAELDDIKKLYELSKNASEGKLVICNTTTSSFLKPVAKPGTFQWCLSDNYLKIFINNEWQSVDFRIGGRSLDLPISNGRF